MIITHGKTPSHQQVWDNLPEKVKSLLTIAMLDLSSGFPDRAVLERRCREVEASLATSPESEHFDILCKMAGMHLLELVIPHN